MAKLTPQQFADKQIQRTSQSSQDYAAGVNRVTESPTAAAARNVNKWQTKVSSAETKDKYVRSLNRTTLEEWKKAATDKGATRLAAGVQAARPKIEAFAAEFLPYLDSGVAKVKAMPSVTLEDNINRANAMMRHNAGFKRSR